jgi:hypothetical protein
LARAITRGGFSRGALQFLYKHAAKLDILVVWINCRIVRSWLADEDYGSIAAAVEILVEKGKFEPTVALGIAEAIEASVMHAQFVTVPILDARLQELRAEIRISAMSLESKLSASVQELKSTILAVEAKSDFKLGELESRIDLKLSGLESRVDRKWVELKSNLDRRFSELETRMERNKAELIRWVFLVMLGNVALSAGATAVLGAFKHIG